ncbi:MAG: hypothetical protein V2B18_15635 [Pseudomonadota bacterium]
MKIPLAFPALRHTGYEDEVIFLDTESGAVYSFLGYCWATPSGRRELLEILHRI